jgi:DNA-binding Lrp family transcriptional regulator
MRDDILKYLRTVSSSTAKTISDRIGAERLDVARELNALHADGIVEREKRNGNEYAYWLTLVDGEPAPTPAAATVSLVADVGVQPDDRTAVLEHQLAGLSNELASVKSELSAAQLARSAAETARDLLKAANDELQAEKESLTATVGKLRENTAALERRIDDLTLGPVGAKSPLFVTVGRYAKPKRHTSIEKAQRRAAALVRGEKESEVLVLEPVGRVVRGSEWRPLRAQRGAQ